MTKWADYILTSVTYGQDRASIDRVVVRADLGGTFGPPEVWTRQQLVRAIAAGRQVVTARKQIDGGWLLGEPVTVDHEPATSSETRAPRRRDSCLALPEAQLSL